MESESEIDEDDEDDEDDEEDEDAEEEKVTVESIPEHHAEAIQNESEKTAHYFVFSGDNKAGMHGYEKKEQAQIIYDMSKNSSFFKQAEKQDIKRKDKISEVKKKVNQYLTSSSRNNTINPLSSLGLGSNNKIMKMVNSYVSEYEARRNLSTIKVVVDMDMFFAAVAIRDRPHLKDKPVAIGGMSMISTSNYVARTFGVRSAMPGFIAKKLCPHLVFVEHEGHKYKEASDIVKNIMLEYDPHLTSFSMDEFFMDLTAYTDAEIGRRHGQQLGQQQQQQQQQLFGTACVKKRRRFDCDTDAEAALDGHENDDEDDEEENSCSRGLLREEEDNAPATMSASASASASTPSVLSRSITGPISGTGTGYGIVSVSDEYRRQVACEVVEEFRVKVFEATGGLTCSAGIANNSFLAKIGADQNKPNGQFSLPPTREAILKFLDTLPCRKIPGIGRVTENILSELELHTMGDISRQRDVVLVAFTPKLGRFLLRMSLGIDSSEGCESECGGGDDEEEDELQKSIGTERTFRGMSDESLLLDKLHHICTRLHEDLEKQDICGQNVTLKIKTSGFQLFTRSCSVNGQFSPASHAPDGGADDCAVVDKRGKNGDVDSILNLATVGTTKATPSLKTRSPIASTKESCRGARHPPVTLRLMGVQISKLSHFSRRPGGDKESIRESKLGKLLLSSSARTSPVRAAVDGGRAVSCYPKWNSPPSGGIGDRAVDMQEEQLPGVATSGLNQQLQTNQQQLEYHQLVQKCERQPQQQAEECMRGRRKKARRVPVSVLDLMYCQPGATDLLAGDVSAEHDTGGDNTRGSSSTSSTSSNNNSSNNNSSSSTSSNNSTSNNNSNNNNNGNGGVGRIGNCTHLVGDCSKIPPPSHDRISSSWSPVVVDSGDIIIDMEDANGDIINHNDTAAAVICPICQHTCKSLFQLNIHLDRNCEIHNTGGAAGPSSAAASKKEKRPSKNQIANYFGCQQRYKTG